MTVGHVDAIQIAKEQTDFLKRKGVKIVQLMRIRWEGQQLVDVNIDTLGVIATQQTTYY